MIYSEKWLFFIQKSDLGFTGLQWGYGRGCVHSPDSLLNEIRFYIRENRYHIRTNSTKWLGWHRLSDLMLNRKQTWNPTSLFVCCFENRLWDIRSITHTPTFFSQLELIITVTTSFILGIPQFYNFRPWSAPFSLQYYQLFSPAPWPSHLSIEPCWINLSIPTLSKTLP